MTPTPPPKVVERPHPLTGVAKSWIALVGLALVIGRDVANNGLESFREFGPFVWVLGGFALVFLGISMTRGIIEWRTTTFVVDDHEFRIERNFLARESTRISYAKIQSVDIERALAARMLGLASVHIDAGGAGGKKLEFLGRARAEALRDQLLDRMRALGGGPLPRDLTVPRPADEVMASQHTRITGLAPGAPDWAPPAPSERFPSHSSHAGPQFHPAAMPQGSPEHDHAVEMPRPDAVWASAGRAVDSSDSPELLVAMKSSTLLLGLVVSGFLPWLLAALAFVVVSVTLWGEFSIAALGGVVFAVGSYLWAQVTGQWNFRLTRTPNGLHVTRGMFTTISRSLKPDRIQAVSIHQDYLQRLTGLYRVRVTVLGFATAEEGGQRADTVLPFGTWADVERVLGAFWPGVSVDDVELHGQPARARWLTPLGFRRHLWGVGDEALVAHHGWLDHTISLVPHRRMQSIDISQGPLQRVLRLARVGIHTTDGPVQLSLHHLDEETAREVFEAQIERARLARQQSGTPATHIAESDLAEDPGRPFSPPGTSVPQSGFPTPEPL